MAVVLKMVFWNSYARLVSWIFPKKLFIQLFVRLTSKKISNPVFQDLCDGNSPVTDRFPSQRASDAESISMSWRHRTLSCWQNCVLNEGFKLSMFGFRLWHQSLEIYWRTRNSIASTTKMVVHMGTLWPINQSHKSHSTPVSYPTILERTCVHFRSNVMHCGIWNRCVVGFVKLIWCHGLFGNDITLKSSIRLSLMKYSGYQGKCFITAFTPWKIRTRP